jgi:hypothetical protein
MQTKGQMESHAYALGRERNLPAVLQSCRCLEKTFEYQILMKPVAFANKCESPNVLFNSVCKVGWQNLLAKPVGKTCWHNLLANLLRKLVGKTC